MRGIAESHRFPSPKEPVAFSLTLKLAVDFSFEGIAPPYYTRILGG